MNNIKFNFSLFRFWCSCGNWNVNFETMSKFLCYAINVDKDIQSFNYAFRCRRCNKIICIKIIARKIRDEFFIENKGRL